MDFKEIINRIFVNKNTYNEVSDEDKISSFFIINRKFGKQYPKIAKEFNHKNVDKASVIDMWFEYFKNVHIIPQWYWEKSQEKLKKIKKNNYDKIKKIYEIKDYDIQFLEKYYEEDLKKELKRIEKLEILEKNDT